MSSRVAGRDQEVVSRHRLARRDRPDARLDVTNDVVLNGNVVALSDARKDAVQHVDADEGWQRACVHQLDRRVCDVLQEDGLAVAAGEGHVADGDPVAAVHPDRGKG